MNIDPYLERLNLHAARASVIEHEEAIVATVYQITNSAGQKSILKICSRPCEYFREVFFLTLFAGKLPVPRILGQVPPVTGLHGAILLECLPGRLLQSADFDEPLMFEAGACLARIHCERVKGFGDLTEPNLCNDPRSDFTLKFNEGLEECISHLPTELTAKCLAYFHGSVDLLLDTDGPCIIHRDYRPGNIFVFEGRLSGIIDWASARGGFAEEDFCPLGLGDWSNLPHLKESLLSGYASVRKLPNYMHVMPLLLVGRAIARIGFTVKRGIWNGKCANFYQRQLQSLQMQLNHLSGSV